MLGEIAGLHFGFPRSSLYSWLGLFLQKFFHQKYFWVGQSGDYGDIESLPSTFQTNDDEMSVRPTMEWIMQRLVLFSSELASERASGQYGSVIDCLIA